MPTSGKTDNLFISEHFNPSAQGNNCGFHCVAHRMFGELLQMPVNEQRKFYNAYQDAYDSLIGIFAEYYKLDPPPKKSFASFQKFLTTINKFNNPIDLEILMGEVLRSYFNTEKNRLNLLDSIMEDTGPAKEVDAKDLILLMPSLGVNIVTKAFTPTGEIKATLSKEKMDEYKALFDATAFPTHKEPSIEIELLNKSPMDKHGSINNGHWLVKLPAAQAERYKNSCIAATSDTLSHYFIPKTSATGSDSHSKLFFANTPEAIMSHNKAGIIDRVKTIVKETALQKKAAADMVAPNVVENISQVIKKQLSELKKLSNKIKNISPALANSITSIEAALNNAHTEINTCNGDKKKILGTILQVITGIDTEAQKPHVKDYPTVKGMFASIKEALKNVARKYLPEAIAQNPIFDSITTKHTKRAADILQQVKGGLLFNNPDIAKNTQEKNTATPDDKPKPKTL